MGVITLEELKDFLKITTEAQDPFLQKLVHSANKAAENYCRRVFDETTVTNEPYDGTGTSVLWLKRRPVTAVTAIKSGWDDANLTTLDSGNYKFTADGKVFGITGIIFDSFTQYWKVSYTAGYKDNQFPDDLNWAVLTMAALEFREQDQGRQGLLSKRSRDAREFCLAVAALPGLRLTGLFTHFPRADAFD
ncbi:MAG: phage head-tail connector protein, partial [Nitrososphaera sp.]|nr:phage head-tail connector protein [Nitrososphaera sp.]